MRQRNPLTEHRNEYITPIRCSVKRDDYVYVTLKMKLEKISRHIRKITKSNTQGRPPKRRGEKNYFTVLAQIKVIECTMSANYILFVWM